MVHRGNGIIIVTDVVKGGTKAEEKQNGVFVSEVLTFEERTWTEMRFHRNRLIIRWIIFLSFSHLTILLENFRLLVLQLISTWLLLLFRNIVLDKDCWRLISEFFKLKRKRLLPKFENFVHVWILSCDTLGVSLLFFRNILLYASRGGWDEIPIGSLNWTSISLKFPHYLEVDLF